MKKLNFKYLLLLFVSLSILSTSCKDDSEEVVSPYVGSYLITKATLTAPLVLTTNEVGELSVPAGTDITLMIQQALLSAINCSANKSYIELKSDYTMFMNCEGTSTTLNAGTWEEVSATVLKLNMNSAAIPSSASGFVLTVSDVTLVNNKLSGATNVPLPEEMLAGMVSLMSGGAATLNLDATPPVMPVDFSLELSKK